MDKLVKFFQRKSDDRPSVGELFVKAPPDNRTLKEKYGTVEHYLWTLPTKELRPKKPRPPIGHVRARYDTHLIRQITDEFTGEFHSTVNVIWDEYVRRVGIVAAYRPLQERLAQEFDVELTRSKLYKETKDFDEFWDSFHQEQDAFKEKFMQDNKGSELPLGDFAFGKYFLDHPENVHHSGYDLLDGIVRYYSRSLYYPVPLIFRAVREEISRRFTTQLILVRGLKLLDEVETYVNSQLPKGIKSSEYA